MPKILSSSPGWLAPDSPAAKLFSASAPSRGKTDSPKWRYPRQSSNASRVEAGVSAEVGPRRVIAHRGTEIFVAERTLLKWADLVNLKTKAEERDLPRRRKGSAVQDDEASPDDASKVSYRILKHPVSEDIRQLVISPNGELMAIVTSHTVHVALLPHPSHLESSDLGEIRTKTYMVGPTVHLLSQAPIVSAKWHPLGVAGNCLVTVTADAEVRVWELNLENRASFEQPTLAVDVRKLADATSYEDDIAVPNFRRNTGFSPDDVEMEVAAACFGGTGSSDENGWASMTLWIAMSEGDVYALCPLLPQKWIPPPTLIPSLSVSLVSANTTLLNDPSASTQARQDAEHQYAWISELDNQEPSFVPSGPDPDVGVLVYTRPEKPGATPRLQGPFDAEFAMEDIGEDSDILLTDIHAISAKLDVDELMCGEDEVSIEGSESGLISVGIICLLDNRGRVRICLDMDGVEGKWLVRSKKGRKVASDTPLPTLFQFESVTAFGSDSSSYDTAWPTFTQDPYSRYAFFVNTSSAVTYMSLSTWVGSLEAELQSGGESGADLRLDVLLKSVATLREKVCVAIRDKSLDRAAKLRGTTASVVLRDSDLGYVLLTAFDHQPHAACFDLPDLDVLQEEEDALSFQDEESEAEHQDLPQTRPVFRAPSSLWSQSPIPLFLEANRRSGHKRRLDTEIRFSQSTLHLMAEAHKILSDYTHHLGIAASQLFRRCERLQEEFRDQIVRVGEVANRVDALTGRDEDSGGGEIAIGRRLGKAKARQTELMSRYEALRRRIGRIGGPELSDKERTWAIEVEALAESTVGGVDDLQDEGYDEGEGEDDAAIDNDQEPTPWQRFQEVKTLTTELIEQARTITQHDKESSSRDNGASDGDDYGNISPLRVPADIRKAKVAQVMRLLERETALVDAARGRLERLSMAG
ncbi:MAG: hypothetical protein M1825_004322 [Sarcosagium campestre]|nr:MAG: hypothetical protein M1825_004322 [Sarcosagium campestre]